MSDKALTLLLMLMIMVMRYVCFDYLARTTYVHPAASVLTEKARTTPVWLRGGRTLSDLREVSNVQRRFLKISVTPLKDIICRMQRLPSYLSAQELCGLQRSLHLTIVRCQFLLCFDTKTAQFSDKGHVALSVRCVLPLAVAFVPQFRTSGLKRYRSAKPCASFYKVPLSKQRGHRAGMTQSASRQHW